jgi:hypothetical protein
MIPQALANNATTAVDKCKDPQTHQDKLDCLLPSEEVFIASEEAGLATGDIATDFIPFFINTGLSIAGTLIFVAFLYSGFLMVFANDNEENIEKGKKIMIYSVVGAVVIATSYAVIFGIANLQLD